MATLVIAILVVVVVALAVMLVAAQRRIDLLLGRLRLAVPHLVRAGLSPDDLEPFTRPVDWRVVASGGNNQPGVIGNLGLCPCQSEYTVANRQTVHAARPNAAQIANCVNNPPPKDPPVWSCEDDCVQVNTHLWHGWEVVHSRRRNQFRLNCYTYAQYHCKKPGDPGVDAPPEPEPPPRPPDVEA